jgi:hypothetical protein
MRMRALGMAASRTDPIALKQNPLSERKNLELSWLELIAVNV